TMLNVEASIGEINLHGGQAEVTGSFAIEFTDSSNALYEITGYGALTLTLNNGVWQVTSAVINDIVILVNGEQVDQEDPVDEEEETQDPAPIDEEVDEEDDED